MAFISQIFNHPSRAGILHELLEFGRQSDTLRLFERQLQEEFRKSLHLCGEQGGQRYAANGE